MNRRKDNYNTIGIHLGRGILISFPGTVIIKDNVFPPVLIGKGV